MKYRKCETCNGTGYEDVSGYYEKQWWRETGKVRCEDCNGTGKQEEEE